MTRVEDRGEVLPADPSSASRARRLAANALRGWGLEHLVDAATLLVSEIVTNALLHAGTEVTLRVTRTEGGARFEVHDESDVVPTPRNFDDDAGTGHGLSILAAMASAWGVERTTTGKAVWFTLGTDAGPEPSAAPAPAVASFPVRLEAVPVSLARTAIEQGEALLRELLLMSLDRGEEVPSALSLPAIDLSPLLAELDAAEAQHRATADVELELPVSAANTAIDRLALVEEADRLAGDGVLLVPPTLAEMRQCRRWLLSEIAMQGRGQPATLLDLDSTADVETVPIHFTDADIAVLGADAASSIVADAANRIVFAGDDAVRVLRWDAASLVGRRLTTIVPPELREAHVVGFTRHQISGESRLLGRPVRISALAGDGSLVDVELQIRPIGGGRYHAVLREG